MEEIRKTVNKPDTQLKRFCNSCKFLSRDSGMRCKVSGDVVKAHGDACTNYIYKERLDGSFYCSYHKADIGSETCSTCVIRCIRSEQRREVDYAGKGVRI